MHQIVASKHWAIGICEKNFKQKIRCGRQNENHQVLPLTRNAVACVCVRVLDLNKRDMCTHRFTHVFLVQVPTSFLWPASMHCIPPCALREKNAQNCRKQTQATQDYVFLLFDNMATVQTRCTRMRLRMNGRCACVCVIVYVCVYFEF